MAIEQHQCRVVRTNEFNGTPGDVLTQDVSGQGSGGAVRGHDRPPAEPAGDMRHLVGDDRDTVAPRAGHDRHDDRPSARMKAITAAHPEAFSGELLDEFFGTSHDGWLI